MTMKSYTMTKAETADYDAGGRIAEELMRKLRERLVNAYHHDGTVEVYTHDDIIVDVIETHAPTDEDA